MSVTTALVVSGGGYQGLALVRALRALADVRVVIADHLEENVTRWLAHAFHLVPSLRDLAGFRGALLDLCVRQRVDVVLPATDHELAVLDAMRHTLAAQGATVYVSSAAVLALAADKLSFYAWAAAQGLAVLPAGSAAELPSLPLPLLGKPRSGFGSRGLRPVHTCEQRRAAAADAALAHYVWQPLLAHFDEYSADVAIDLRGDFVLALRRRVRTLAGFAVLCEPSEHPAALALARQAVAALAAIGAQGMLNLQVLVDERGQAWLSDLNARVGTSLPASVAAGRNPLAFLLHRPEEPARGNAPGRRVMRVLVDRLVDRVELRDVRGVVFDLDDTLIDQKDWIVRKLRLVWQAEGARLPGQDVFLRQALAQLEEGHRADLYDALCAALDLGEDVKQRLIRAHRQACPDVCRVFPDARAVLLQLRRDGFRLALLTDNPAASQRQKLERSGLERDVDATVLTATLGAAKPHPDCFRAAARSLGLEPRQLVMVGDHLFRDALGALDAGFRHAFLIRRAGTFFNFSGELARSVVGDARITELDDLAELHRHLPTGRSDDPLPSSHQAGRVA